MSDKPVVPMLHRAPLSARIGIVSILSLAYLLVIILPILPLHHRGGAFALIPVAVAGWILGVRGGLVTSVSLFLCSLAVYMLNGTTGWAQVLGSLPFSLTMIASGVLIGALRDFSLRAHRLTTELEREREALRASDEERRRTEEKIRAINLVLEDQVKRRTAELTAANRELAADIERRTRMEDELRRSEEKFRILFNSGTDILLVHELDPEGRHGIIIEVNDVACRLLEYSRREMLGNMPSLFADPGHRPPPGEFRRRSSEILSNRTVRFDTVLKTKSGTAIPVEIASVQFELGGKKTVLSIARDITERKRAEQELRNSEERYRVLFNSASDMMLVHNPGRDGSLGRIIQVNDVTITQLGFDRERLYTMAPDDLSPASFRPGPEEIQSRIQQMRQTGRIHFEATVARADGALLYVDVLSVRFELRGEPAILTVMRDMTEKRKTDEMLSNMQKLESIGVLAGGIAHDFNNLLTAIFGHLDVARMLAAADLRIMEPLTEASGALTRARALTEQLLTFSKGGEPVRKPTSIVELLRGAVSFVLAGSNVRAEFAFASDLWSCDIDPNQIAQAIDNIVINARQAMPDGGTIRISADNIELPAPEDVTPLVGRFVKISMTDEGPGIARENLGRIFDPFFTTKPKGNGLGLAMAYSIVKKHGGYITAESEPGAGARFVIYLPAIFAAVESGPSRPETVRQGSGRILLMDDEDLVRKATGRLLGVMGYDVVAVADGGEAVREYAGSIAKKEPFDLVLLDLTIAGGAGGKTVLADLVKIDACVRAVAISGYSDDPIIADPRHYGFAGAIRKPFSVEELAETMERLLADRKRPDA